MDGLEGWVLPTPAEPFQARAAIASAVLSDRLLRGAIKLGSIALHPHQVGAVHRLRDAIDEFGGAILCDPVGTGKTFTALALIPDDDRAVVVAPAVLRSMWIDAAQRANRDIAFISFEALSRGAARTPEGRFLIVDEAHHARNPATQRFGSLSRLAVGRDVLLMSATPIHNRRKDLTTTLSLFLGSRAERLSSAELGRCVLRRDAAGLTSAITPRIERLQWLAITENEKLLTMILALPPPLPPSDGGNGGVLVTHSLVRQWASSDGALRSGIVRRLQKSLALIASLEDGVYPSRSDLRSWIGHDDSVQLTFSALLAPATADAATLLPTVLAHRHALVGLLHEIDTDRSRDRERSETVRHLRSKHPGARIVVFSQFARTVETMFALLAPDGRVAALTGSGAQVAGGRIPRAEAIVGFAPKASNRAPPRQSEEITLLLTTDLLSEGVNLQDASVVIHLDLPWTPARMEQRLGRIARLGSAHDRVHSYAIRPPACVEALIRTERILREKIEASGVITSDFPSLSGGADYAGPVRRSNTATIESIREQLLRWIGEKDNEQHQVAIVSAVEATTTGFVAVCGNARRVRLVASRCGTISENPDFVLNCLRCCDSGSSEINDGSLEQACSKLGRYLALDDALTGIRPAEQCRPSIAESILTRVSRISQRARPHERAEIALLAARARIGLTRNLGAALERRLSEIEQSAINDREWLREIVLCLSSHLRETRNSGDASALIAMIILQPTGETNALSRATER